MEPMTPATAAEGAYDQLDVTPVINACGIYTDFGGCTLEPEVWAALGQVNARWASLIELLDRAGERIAALVQAPAARVVPGASAAIALATAACIAREDDALIETLPARGSAPGGVAQQVVHAYKYTRCALLGGGTIVDVGDAAGTTASQLAAALANGEVVAILHPVHLDEVAGGLPLREVIAVAREHDVPVIVDAAYQVYPTELLSAYHAMGADLVATSAKYMSGPNAGGFLAGRADLIDRVRALDFTEFESGSRRTFGRAFKLDRITVAATALALERWIARDHGERWAGYERLAHALVERLASAGIVGGSAVCFTFQEEIVAEPINAVLLPHRDGRALAAALANATPAVRCIDYDDGVLFCLETVAEDELDGIVAAVAATHGEAGA